MKHVRDTSAACFKREKDEMRLSRVGKASVRRTTGSTAASNRLVRTTLPEKYMTPYYEQDGYNTVIQYHHASQVFMRMWTAHSSEQNVCLRTQPEATQTHRAASAAYWGSATQGVANQTAAATDRNATFRPFRLCRCEGAGRQGRVEVRARHRHGAVTWSATATIRSDSPRQRRSCGQRGSQSLSLPRSIASQRCASVGSVGVASPISARNCHVQGRQI